MKNLNSVVGLLMSFMALVTAISTYYVKSEIQISSATLQSQIDQNTTKRLEVDKFISLVHKIDKQLSGFELTMQNYPTAQALYEESREDLRNIISQLDDYRYSRRRDPRSELQ